MNLPYQWYQKIKKKKKKKKIIIIKKKKKKNKFKIKEKKKKKKKKKKIKLYSYKGNQIRKLVILTNSFIYLAFIISIKRIVHFI